jgi:regulatory protein
MTLRKRTAAKLDAESLYDHAARLLSGRALSAAELRRKLQERAAQPEDAARTISRLKEAGFLDDERFAESFAASRRDGMGFGRFRVAQELKKRRVPPALADEAVKAAYAEVNEEELAAQFIERRMRGRDMKDEKNLASAYRRLRTAGFGSATAIRVLRRYSARAAELESLEDGAES